MGMSSRAKAWAIGLACIVLLEAAASLWLPRSFGLVALSDLAQSFLLLSAAVACIPSAIRTSGRTRLFWILMSLGFTGWLTYQLLWTYIEVIQKGEVPSLFTGDIILFL